MLTAFWAGMQYAYDKMPGNKKIPSVYIGDHTHGEQKHVQPVYDPKGKRILLPIIFVINEALKPENHREIFVTKAGKYIGYLPKFAFIAEGGVEEMAHAIQHQQNRLPKLPKLGSGIIPDYNKQPHEQEALRFRNTFLADICDIPGFFDSEIMQQDL